MMAISQGTVTDVLALSERTWRIELFCEVGQDYTLIVHREVLGTKADGTVVLRDRNIPNVSRSLSQIASQDFGGGFTGALLAQKIAGVADALRQEDISRAQNVVN